MSTVSESERSDQSENAYCIFLHIVEGIGLYPTERGVDFSQRHKDKILLTCSLNGVKFEIEGHSTEAATIFNSNCVWECDLGDVKRMKTDNRPVKVECFLKGGNLENSSCKCIGSLLLPIRGVQTIATLRNLHFKIHWHKLNVLCSEYRQNKPEIYLLLLIVKKTLLEDGKLEDLLGKKKQITNDFLLPNKSETNLMLQSQNNIYVQLLEQVGLIQVGNNPDIDCDLFNVTITFKTLKNVAKLLELEQKSYKPNDFVFNYDFYGTVSNMEINVNTEDCYSINEKISLSYKSSIRSLRLYFQRIFYIPINLYLNGKKRATYRLNLFNLLPDDNYFNLLKLWTKVDVFHFDYLTRKHSPHDCTPSVEFIFCVHLLTSHAKRNNYDINVLNEALLPFGFDEKAAGDIGNELYTNIAMQQNPQMQRYIQESGCVLLSYNNLKKLESQERNCINLSTESSQSAKDHVYLKPTEELINEREKASQKMICNGLHQQLPTQINNVLAAEINDHVVVTKEINDNIVETKMVEHNVVVTTEIKDNVVVTKEIKDNVIVTKEIKDNVDATERTAELKIKEPTPKITENKAVQYDINPTRSIAVNTEPLEEPPTLPDTEDIALKIVQELEDWKEQQMDHFLSELERKEVGYLADVDKQWQKQRAILQARLETKIAHCEALNDKLEKAQEELNLKAAKDNENRIMFENMKRDIEESYAEKFQTLDKQMESLKMEMQQKSTMFEHENTEVHFKNRTLENERVVYVERIAQLERQLAAMEKTHLSANQLEELLADLRLQTERSAEIEKTKEYYKEKWVRSTNEVQKLKLSLLEQEEKILKHQEDDCVDMCLEEILDVEQEALQTDREELKLLKDKLFIASDSSSVYDLSENSAS